MAERQHEGSLGKTLYPQDLGSPGGVLVADPLKVDQELKELFSAIAHADPSTAAKDGNFNANVIPVTTPAVANTEFAVAHSLGRTPVGWHPVVPAKSGYGWADLENNRDADGTYLYLKSAQTSKSLSVIVW